MEKKKTIKIIKLTFVIFYLVVFVGLSVFQIWAKFSGLGVSFESLIYWWLLVGWVFLIINFKWGSSASLIPVFLLFILGAFFATVGFREVAETTMRISFIGWLVGIVQALVEYKKR